MKPLSKNLLVLLLCLNSAVSFSQNKPAVFSQFPDVVNCYTTEFSKAFESREGDYVKFIFSNNLIVVGKVLSNEQKYSNLRSMIIVVPDYADAIFHLSRQTNQDQTYSYVGRLLSTKAVDGYVIKTDTDGTYKFHKVQEENLRQICNL